MSSTPLQASPRPLVPRSPASVLVLASSPPAEPHVDVALLQAEQPRAFQQPRELDELIERLRAAAAQLGCDAIYIKSSGELRGHDELIDPNVRQMLATCIVFTPPGAARGDAVETAHTRRLQLAPPADPR